MAGKSNYFEDKCMNWVKGTAMGTAPVAVYLALFNGDPTDAGSGGTEVTTGIRPAGRLAVTLGSITTSLAGNSMANSAEVDFGAADVDTTITHAALFDASTAGNMLYSAALSSGSSVVAAGSLVKFPIGNIVFTES